MQIVALLLALSSTAIAAPIPAREQVASPARLPGGTGFDKRALAVHGTTENFNNGVYYLRIDVAQRKLTNYRLPSATFTNYCGYHRVSGGRIGDYKPKSISRSILVHEQVDAPLLTLWQHGRGGEDYNETPLAHTFPEFHPRGTRLEIPSDSRLMNFILHRCRNTRPYPWVRITWRTDHSCRWKPELWHKPELWRDEYEVRYPSTLMITKTLVLHCVNR